MEHNDVETMVRLLLCKLDPDEHVRCTSYIRLAEPRTLAFPGIVQTINKPFDQTPSLFSARFKCIQILKKEANNFVTYAGFFNTKCERFCVEPLTEDGLRCFILIRGPKAPRYEHVRTRLQVNLPRTQRQTTASDR